MALRRSGPRASGKLGSVFYVSVGICALFVVWASVFTENLTTVSSMALDWLTGGFGWAYLVVSLAMLLFLVYLACSRHGRGRLGGPGDRPEFSRWSWYAMILAAVMGVGLISYGVAEPIAHFAAPPHDLAAPGSREPALLALQYSYFDWGLHAWAIFGVFGLAIGFSTYRKGRRGLVSPMLRPVLGRRVDGWLGKAIDVLAIFSTMFGTTTSLGLGAVQMNSGLTTLWGVPSTTLVQVLIIVAVTGLFTLSAVTGVHKGIRFLSETTMGLAALLFVFLLAVGPTVFVVNLFVESVGAYADGFFGMSLKTSAFGDLPWMQSWTYFMMAWWISWGAFVGVFLARISRGRTIREFVVAVLAVPSTVFFAWFAVFGGSAIERDYFHGADIAGSSAGDAIFATLGQFPLAGVTSFVAIVLVALFFVSGADANTYVLAMLSSHGVERPKRAVLVVWGVLTGVTAVVLLLAGGLNALQTTVIITSAPFVVLLVLLAVSFWKELRAEPREEVLAEELETELERTPVS
ncbi:BCCT family transporter [Amycolatopsis ruanii]|uniref:BCCT family transporter n=1 Tax=Amycolatopsis ruanii TaxID=944491 RepID=UPI000E21F829|nr:BCCT family transporter [Amycolatopsis ruanii]